ncbi:helix-turn-helix transcriptional regulator [Actinomadura rugatobispora]|uniref:Helix-turn-helix transcriptional regulator n=1 Tax=Actinomadura rugatobispora TaxID=1994 RepID=A0ABW1AFP7_9ACTN|nr:hypothetical protein GCM10010200_072450 [Actinomadura rugatobispora]
MTAVRQPLGDSLEVAEYLKVSVRTLDDWAHKGVGPVYHRVGKHRRYRWSEIEKWLDQQSNGGEAA